MSIRGPATRRSAWRARLMVGSAMMLAPVAAQAQTLGANAPVEGVETAPAETPGEDIVVTGLRAGIERSLSDKRSAISVVDVISAEDIGKFPDNNLAESLQRVPGITIDRSVTGEGQTINLRGLGPQFTRSEINGGTALNGFDFSVLAPELFARIEVEKSPTASTVEGGLAGTVKIETPKPFDIQGFRATVTGGVTIGQKAEPVPRFFGLVSRNWDDRYGLTLGVAYSKTDFRTNEVDFGPWVAFRNIASADVLATAPAVLLDAATPRTTAFYSYQQKRDNLGITLAGQARPTETLELTTDFLYARRRGTQIDDRPDAPIEGTSFFADGTSSPGNQAPVDYVIENGAVTQATFRNIQNRVGYSYQPQENEVYQGTLRAKWQTAEHLTITPGFSYAHQRASNELNLFSFAAYGADVTYRVDGDVPQFSSTATDFSTNPEAFGYNVFIFNRAVNTIGEYVGRVDATRDFDDVPGLASIQAGARYTHRTSRQRARNVGLYRGAELLGDNPLGLGSFADTLKFSVRNAETPDRILSVDRQKLIDTIYPGLDPFNSDQFATDPQGDTLNSFEVIEQTYGGYLQGNFDFGSLSVNAGVRAIVTDTDSRGSSLIGTELTPSNVQARYTNFLPAFNARWEVAPNMLIRGTYSRAMTRPTLDQLSPATVINSGPRTGTRGNPNLRPYLADQEDLGFEWYFHPGALLTINGFAKQINSLISQTTVSELASFPDQETGQPTSGIVAFTQPTNGDNATIHGVEAGVQSPFFFLPGQLSYFGGILNFTYASSKATTRSADGSSRTTPLPGLSKKSANAVLYYDHAGLDARLAYAWRSTYLRADAVGAQFGAERYIRGYGQLDLSVNAFVLPSVQLGFNVNNLLDTQRKEYILIDSGAKMPASFLEQERRFVLTARIIL
ncbi:TonB-dependent receptor [Sphingomonas sp. PL-96]|uniref:TonB-dependent receptor n=1 Tax=Sphingomonas sp. PL-96 TaxID=2887201 RepID=UPI001E3397EB|nr:TonB-dependent receptor [Sphingomonas sp. PL-96]MCC2977922.1 TonB-dependent receptor [Sphingomonas sp. PL-96]